MKSNTHRKHLRLQGYDYSQNGAYFITICVQDKLHLFGEVVGEHMHLNDAGSVLETQWLEIPNRFNHVQLDEYRVMPNHFHAIIFLDAPLSYDSIVELPTSVNDKNSHSFQSTISDIIGAFKSLFAYEYIQRVKSFGWQVFNKKLWQRSYYEHVIRDDTSLHKIREYIINNPINWHIDEMNH